MSAQVLSHPGHCSPEGEVKATALMASSVITGLLSSAATFTSPSRSRGRVFSRMPSKPLGIHSVAAETLTGRNFPHEATVMMHKKTRL